MTASFHSPIARTGPGTDRTETPEPDTKQERPDDAWTLAITQALVEGVRPRLTLPEAPEAGVVAAPARTSGAESVQAPLANAGDAGATQNGAESAPLDPALPTRLIAELSDDRLGRMELSVGRGANGLHIVINVADSHVKALIEADQALLWKSLQGCGLRIDSVEIGSEFTTGTGLAQQQATQERALARSRGNPGLNSANARWRGYTALPEDDPEDDPERVDLTA